jgi:hypothetical protein
MANGLPSQVHECPKCHWRYPTPLKATVWCPNDHYGEKGRALPSPIMDVIWTRSDGTEPPSLVKEQG